jgi:restriction system protein
MITQASLDEWLESVAEDEPGTITYSFPNSNLRDEYLASIEQSTDDDVTDLLRNFLISSCSLGIDEILLDHFKRNDTQTAASEFRRRLFEYEGAKILEFEGVPPPWEGVTWTLDLLADNPRAAISTIEAYFLAHGLLMPDGRIAGLFDAMEIIRAKYIERPRSPADAIRLLLNEPPRTPNILLSACTRPWDTQQH